MTVCLWFLPERVNLRLPTFLDHGAKARRFYLEQFHSGCRASAAADASWHQWRFTETPYKKKSARELRQGGSDYRCCIPALAGFVSPQSIAPDGNRLFSKVARRAIGFCVVDRSGRFCLHRDCEIYFRVRNAARGHCLQHAGKPPGPLYHGSVFLL